MYRWNGRSYDYVNAEIIRRASDGDVTALDAVIQRYLNYGRSYLREIAKERYSFDIRPDQIDDLMQHVCVRLFILIVKKFECNR